MSYNLVINSSNVVNSLNNQYRYDFINGSFEIPENSEIMISSLQIPYSWYNISTRYNNRKFTIFWPTGSNTYNTYNVELPEGFYTTVSLDAYLQQFAITNGLYLIETATQRNNYYISVVYNFTAYANQVVLKTVPTTLPAGFTAPANWAGYPTVSRTPYVEILQNNDFGKFLGFKVGTIGFNKTSNYSENSPHAPLGSNVNSLVIKCNLVNNNVSSQTDIVDSFAINGNFGSNLNFNNNIEKWIRLNSGRYYSFIVTIVDEKMRDIQILDNNILINFIIRTRK
jgi:hypothetical protein